MQPPMAKSPGTVKLDGAAPHMKGIDMSKDPFCVKQHENSPAHLENVLAGPGGGLQNVVLYISEGLSGAEASQVPSQEPVFDQKNCMYTPHVLAMDVNQKFKVSDQRSDDPQHSPTPERACRQYPVEQIAAAGSPADRDELEDGRGRDPGEVQHPSLDARLFRSCERTICGDRRERFVHH